MRPVKIPDGYSREIATLHRIASAVKADDRLPADGREACVADLHRAIRRLMAFELASIDESGTAETAESETSETGETGETAETSGDAS